MRLMFLCALLLCATQSFGSTSSNIIKTAMDLELEGVIDPLIYSGTKSLPTEFPAMGWIGNCTATAVGPNVVISAAHCKSTGARITFEHRQSGKNYAGTCTRHPRYNTRTIYNDYVFCKLDQSLPEGTIFASIDLETVATVGEQMLLNGFGQPNIRVHYWGKAGVTRISGQDIVTCGPSNLGSGDSGGSLLTWTEDRSGKTIFKVRGINSRGGGGCSYFNKTTDSEFTSWVKTYETSASVQICGVSLDCSSDPQEPPTPEQCSAMYADLAQCMVSDPAGSCSNLYGLFKQCLKGM